MDLLASGSPHLFVSTQTALLSPEASKVHHQGHYLLVLCHQEREYPYLTALSLQLYHIALQYLFVPSRRLNHISKIVQDLPSGLPLTI